MFNQRSSTTPANDLIEIRDPNIDAQTILEAVRERMRARGASDDYQIRQFPSFGGAEIPHRRSDLNLDPNLHYYLDLVNKSYSDFETGSDVQLSPTMSSRLLGRFWSLIRRQAHQLVLYYVNRSVEHQVSVNRQLVSIVNLLTAALQEQQYEIIALRNELDEMKYDEGHQ